MSSLSVKSMDPHPMHHNCHPLWKILFAFLKIFFALRSTTGYKVCMHSEHQPKTFYKDPNVRMVIWEWDWERVGLLVGCEKRELLCRKGRVSDRWGKWSVCVTAVNHQNVCTTWVHQCLRHQCVHRLGAAHPFKVVQSTNLHHLHCTTNIFIEGNRDKLGKTIAIHHSWEPAKCSKCGHNLWLTRESSRNCCCPTTTPTLLPSIHCSCSSGPSSAFTGVATHTWYTGPVQSYCTARWCIAPALPPLQRTW